MQVTTVSGTMEFSSLKGETLVKQPGSINGESFVIKDLEECSVFILDYSSEVEVSNCSNCQIFIGPVDGPAIFEGCTNCQVAVAANLFKANACTGCEFGIYSATQPAISASSSIRIGCWAGAYPLLTQHFAAAHLDPNNNQWNKVYDADAEEGEGGAANFELLTTTTPYWEVPLEGGGFGPPDNPVPAADGSRYQAPAAVAAAVTAETEAFAFENPTFEGGAATENGVGGGAGGAAISDDFLGGGGAGSGEYLPSATAETVPSGMLEPAGAGGEHPRVSAAKQRLQQRIRDQGLQESEQKAVLLSSAAAYLERYYAQRNAAKAERIRAGRQELEGKGNGEVGPAGSSEWERICSVIDFQMPRPQNSTDLSRFKSVLLTCKATPPITAA